MLYVSNIIRKVMIDRGVTVTDLSRKMDMLQPSLSRKLQDQKADYKLSMLCDILQSLDCNIRIQIIDNNNKEVLYTIDSE